MSETVEKRITPLRTTKKQEDVSGVWRLKYKLINRMGSGGFGGKNLTTYNDPLTGKPRHLYNAIGNRTNGYFIEKQVTHFYPDDSAEDRNIVDWLLGHPQVGIEIEHANLTKEHLKFKEDNPRMMLVNLDYEEVVDLEEEDYIDKLVGRISLDSGTQSLSLEKLRYVLSALNQDYLELKHLNNKHVAKQKLRKRLKDYARRGFKHAEDINDILDSLDSAKLLYEIKEMRRKEIIYITNGMYKYDSVPLGTSTESVMKYFSQNSDLYAELQQELEIRLKREIKNKQ